MRTNRPTPRPCFVSYDVTDDRRRAIVRSALRERGDWAQGSLWVIPHMTPTAVDELVDGMVHLLDGRDRLLVHRPCPTCLRAIRWHPAWDGADPRITGEAFIA